VSRTARAVVLEKQEMALTLVKAGHSYEEIAAELGYASRSSAWRLVTNGLKNAVSMLAEDYLQLELDRLDALQAAVWQSATNGDIAAAGLVLRIMEQRESLLALDKPKPVSPGPCTVVCPALYATRNATDAGDDSK
jgi:hypothetical protein